MTNAWWRIADGEVRVSVRLTPKGGADRIEGPAALADGAVVLAVRVSAAAEKGAANTALEKLIARALGVAATKVAVVVGHKARLKTVHVAVRADELEPRLARLGRTAGRSKTA